MVELVPKILYYEHLLAIKINSNTGLYLNEVNNWKLCRTCLKETTEDDLDLRNMCVMEAQEGRMLNGLEVLRSLAKLEESGIQADDLPVKVCLDCLNKIQSFYYFTIQVRKAENILKLLAHKLKTDQAIRDATSKKIANNPTTVEVIEIKEENDVKSESIESPNICQNNIKENSADSKHPQEVVYTISFKDEPELQINDAALNENIDINEQERPMNNTNGANSVVETPPNLLKNNCNKNSKKTLKNRKTTATAIDSSNKLPKILDNKCPICDKIFNDGEIMIDHANKFHPKMEALECRHCSSVFSNIPALYQHNTQEHIYWLRKKLIPGFAVSKYFNSVCRICDEKLDNRNEVIEHNRKYHSIKRVYPVKIDSRL